MKTEFTFTMEYDEDYLFDLLNQKGCEDADAYAEGARQAGKEFADALLEFIQKQPLIRSCKLDQK